MTGRNDEREVPSTAPWDDARGPANDGPQASKELDAWLDETFPASDRPPLWPARPGAPRRGGRRTHFPEEPRQGRGVPAPVPQGAPAPTITAARRGSPWPPRFAPPC